MAEPAAIPVIYLGVCCLNRPVDDQSQERVAAEAVAVAAILRGVEEDRFGWVCSDAVLREAGQTSDPDKRGYLLAATRFATSFVMAGEAESRRARQLEVAGISWLDSLHVACAERGGATVFLTVDDVLMRRLRRMGPRVAVPAANPVDWLREVLAQ